MSKIYILGIKDVAAILDKSLSTSQRILSRIKKATNKTLITHHDFCAFTKIEHKFVEKVLEKYRTGNDSDQ